MSWYFFPFACKLNTEVLTPAGGSLFASGSLLNISLQRSHPALYIASITSLTSIPGAITTDLKKRLCCCMVRHAVSVITFTGLLIILLYLNFPLSIVYNM